MRIFVFSCCLTFAALAWGQSKPAPTPVKSLAERLKELEHRVVGLELETRFRPVYAQLDCETKRFGSVQSDDVSKFLLLVSCESIEPYLEGYRITLRVGNPYSIRMSAVKGSLFYGAKYPRKKAEIPLPQGLTPGHWTEVSVSIGQAEVADMRRLSAEFVVEQLSAPKGF
jgi:hypothetical protein